MKRLILSIFLLLPGPASADCVVLMHGLARSDASLLVMEAALEQAGYRVINSDYPSTKAPIEDLVAGLCRTGGGRVRGRAREFRHPFDGRHTCQGVAP
jgi:hypothetical protein